VSLSVIEGIVLAISALGSSAAALIGLRNARHITKTKENVQEVHVLVNNRLDAALEKIGRLQDQIKETNGHPTT
jgi:hypothetical protein